MRRFSRRSAGSTKSSESDPNRPKTPTSTSTSSAASRIARGKEKLTGASAEDVKSSPKSKGSLGESPRSRKETAKPAPQEKEAAVAEPEPKASESASQDGAPRATTAEHLKPLPAESVPTPVEEKPASEEKSKNEEKPLPEVKPEDKLDSPSQEERRTDWETVMLPENEKASQDGEEPAREESLPVKGTPVEKEEEQEEKPSSEAKPAQDKAVRYGWPRIASADYTIYRLNKLLSTTSGQETILAAINYSSQMLHHGLSSPALLALFTRIRRYLNLPLTRQNPLIAKGPSGKPPLLALSDLMTETRTTLRLFGLLGVWSWGAGILRRPPSDPLLRAIAFTQVLAGIIYQFMENVAYLASKGIVSERAVERWGGVGNWYIWSTRAWLAHVLLEFVRLTRERQQSSAAAAAAARNRDASSSASGEKKTEKEDVLAHALDARVWKKSLVNNLAWAPLCLHWSAEQGVGVSDSMVSVLGFLAGAWGLVDSWRATAVWT